MNTITDHGNFFGGHPLLSVIVPVWNRVTEITRCLDSVTAQNSSNVEIVVVDDASTDTTVAEVESLAIPGMSLVRHKQNQGVCSARNTGTRHAKGEWLLFLDSDWTLREGALEHFTDMANTVNADVAVIGSYCHTENDEILPYPHPPSGVFGFDQYLAWLNPPVLPDYLYAIRREALQETPWPTDRRLEAQFHLRMIKRWPMLISDRVCAEVYYSSTNRYSTVTAIDSVDRSRMISKACLVSTEEIFDEFGDEIRRKAPQFYQMLLRRAASLCFTLGRRLSGIKHCLRMLLRNPLQARGWLILAAGMMGSSNYQRLRKHFGQ